MVCVFCNEITIGNRIFCHECMLYIRVWMPDEFIPWVIDLQKFVDNIDSVCPGYGGKDVDGVIDAFKVCFRLDKYDTRLVAFNKRFVISNLTKLINNQFFFNTFLKLSANKNILLLKITNFLTECYELYEEYLQEIKADYFLQIFTQIKNKTLLI